MQYTYDKRNLSSVQRTNNGKSQTYGNGAVVSYTYDKLGRTKTATYDDGRVHNGTVIRHITERDNWKNANKKASATNRNINLRNDRYRIWAQRKVGMLLGIQ